eukprot:m51a1_g3319 putative trx2p (158) ;mRNA; r:351786-352429
MCYPVKCPKCSKTTWAGCGAHVDMVMSRVPVDQRCTCGKGVVSAASHVAETPATAIRHVTKFEELQQQAACDKLTVVDFFATWCAPCKMMAPKFEAMAGEFKGCTFLKVNGDDAAECVEKANVTAFPTFHLYKGGKLVSEVVGVDEAGLRKAIKANM